MDVSFWLTTYKGYDKKDFLKLSDIAPGLWSSLKLKSKFVRCHIVLWLKTLKMKCYYYVSLYYADNYNF